MKKIPNFEELKYGSIITINSGEKFIKTDNLYLSDFGRVCNGEYLNDKESYNIKKDLIIKIEEPVNYKTIILNDEPIEMTIEEISDILGYDIKIVKKK